MTIATVNDFYNFPRNYVNVSSSVNEKKNQNFLHTSFALDFSRSYFEKLRLKHCDKKRSLIVCHIKGLYTLDIFAHNISIKDKKILR